MDYIPADHLSIMHFLDLEINHLMYIIKEYDVVKSVKDLNNEVLKGCIGTVVFVHKMPSLAYEVEFFDDDQDTIGVLTVYPDDIDLILAYPN